MAIGVFPGSFNPLTIAHLAVADRARHACRLERVDLVVSRVALAKEHVVHPSLDDRVEVLRRAAATRPWLGVVVTDRQLLVDIARGYDVLILGEDKWAQIQDARFYGSHAARDAALRALPRLFVVPRPGHAVSSTAARAGRREWMAPEAVAYDDETGAWSSPASPKW